MDIGHKELELLIFQQFVNWKRLFISPWPRNIKNRLKLIIISLTALMANEIQILGLKYFQISLLTAKLIVFVDGSFANNKDYSSLIGCVITLVNESQ